MSITGPRIGRSGVAAWLLAIATFGALAGVAIFLPESRLAVAFHDDAFYYFGVARNLAAGNGCTFDGIHPTNGFHPLWMVVLVPVFLLTGGDAAALRIALAIQLVLVATAAIALFRALAPRLGAGAMVAGLALVTLPGSAFSVAGGLESSLVLLLLVWTWRKFERTAGAEEGGLAAWFAVGCLCLLGFLARFEALVLAPACALLARRQLRKDPRRAAALLMPTVVGLLAYAIGNHLVFGTCLPVSALVKSEWAARIAPWEKAAKILNIPWPWAVLLDAAFAHSGWFPGPVVDALLRTALLAIALLAAWKFRRALILAIRSAQAGYLLLVFATWLALDLGSGLYIEPWNRVPMQLCAALLIGALVAPHRKLATTLCALLFLVSLTRLVWTAETLGARRSSPAIYRYQAALWLRERTPEQTRIGSWNGGLLGFASHRAVVNLDGLVNDRRYYREVVVGGNLDSYLASEGITWIADQMCGLTPSLDHYLARSGSGHLAPEFEVQAVFANPDTPDQCPGYVVWRRRERPREGSFAPGIGEARIAQELLVGQ